jgi:hypothetical protein
LSATLNSLRTLIHSTGLTFTYFRPRLKHTRTAAVDGTDEPPELNHNLQPNKKQRVDFGSVDVYSFNFTQSYDTIPTEGGIPIGMEDKHHEVRHYESYRDFQRERFAENVSACSLSLLIKKCLDFKALFGQ